MENLVVYYRPDNYPNFIFWRRFDNQFSLIGTKSELGVGGLPSARPGFAPRTAFGKPPTDADTLATNRNLRRGFNFQILFAGFGHVVLDRFRLHAQKLVEKSRSNLPNG